MRLSTMVETSVLAAIVSTVLFSAIGCRHCPPPPTQAVISVDPGGLAAYTTLRKGQKLRWEAPAGQSFNLIWMGGPSPCDDHLQSIPSRTEQNFEVVTCTVETPPTNSHILHYRVEQSRHTPPSGAQPRPFDDPEPCYACDFFSGSQNRNDVKILADQTRPYITLTCNTSYKISLDYPKYTLLPGALSLNWYSSPDGENAVNIDDIKVPDNPNICDNKSGTWTCNFAKATTSPPWTYSITATGKGTSYCGGANTHQGTNSTDFSVTK